ncbi:ATP-binding protein [Pelistega sp. MC2]|uniref:ATP-binding protein n=1 Tax=Pelistega sp. MC2 TaxID=1720297 RepID=UPI0009F4B232|nr:ATP-binding protein [Pelistega sp. MC2]
MSQHNLDLLIQKAIGVLSQLEAWLPPTPDQTDWNAKAFRWRKKGETAWLEAINVIDSIEPSDLMHIEKQKEAIERNTRFFVQGKPANNVLMTGARGTGKSSLVKAMLAQFHDEGLRLIEVDKSDLGDLSDIVDLIHTRPERFIIFCDDLSFDEGEVSYKALKSILDGSIAASSDNVLIYATSNRRHLMPEYMSENLTTAYQDDGEVHPGEAIEEKISLSERFGLWLSFYPFRQEDYLAIVYYWLRDMGCPEQYIEESRTEALQWAIQRGSRSGRVAKHFARDWTARHMGLENDQSTSTSHAPKSTGVTNPALTSSIDSDHSPESL